MLIGSPRHRRDDLDAWRNRERLDVAYASVNASRLADMASAARSQIVRFSRDPCYLGISWGKDSVVVAHLLATAQPSSTVRCVYFVHAPRDNPDCGLVRDAFFSAYTLDYREHLVDPRRPGDETSKAARYARWVREAGLPRRRITGIRGAESRSRALSVASHGIATEMTCRPIARWSTADVFAYLCAHALPVHPAYAQSLGGTLDREWLRVAPLGGNEGTGHGRAEWERAYYRRELSAPTGHRRQPEKSTHR